MRSTLRKQINLIILCILLSAFTCKLYAQQYDKAIVKISQTSIDITTLAKTIAKQTGLEYSLNMQNASLKKRIALYTGNWRLQDILKQVQQQAGLNYRILGDHILFMDYQPPVNKTAVANVPARATPPTKPATNPKVSIDNASSAVKKQASVIHPPQNTAIAKNKRSVSAKVTKPTTTQAIRAESQSNLASNNAKPVNVSKTPIASKGNTKRPSSQERNITGNIAVANKERSMPLLPVYAPVSNDVTPKVLSLAIFEGTDSAGNKKMLPRFSVPSLMKNIAAAKSDKTKQKEKGNNQQHVKSPSGITRDGDPKWYTPFVKAGISADEILYLNASLTAGIKYVYGIISYGSAFPGGRLRWGAGIPVKLNDEQQLHFTFTTGSLTRTTNPDSPVVYGVKESLTRYGAGWSKTVSPHITFQAQLYYNILKKTSDSTREFTQNQAGDYKHFEYGRVPYALSENYSTDGDFKRWIGIQISFFYTLF